MIMEFSTLITKTTKILNEVLNSFEANKYVNTFIVNKKKYVNVLKSLAEVVNACSLLVLSLGL